MVVRWGSGSHRVRFRKRNRSAGQMRATDAKYDRYMPGMDQSREVTMCSRSSRTDWIRHRRYENGRPDPIDMHISAAAADHQRSPLPCDLVCVCAGFRIRLPNATDIHLPGGRFTPIRSACLLDDDADGRGPRFYGLAKPPEVHGAIK